MADTSKKNLVLREFGALNTQPLRNVIGDKEFYWLQEFMPIGHGNLKMVPGPSAALATITVGGQSIYYMATAVIGAANYLFAFLTDGSAYMVNTDIAPGQLSQPSTITGSVSSTGGTIAAGTYYAQVAALDGLGNSTIVNFGAYAAITSGSTSTITWSWPQVVGATAYRIWVYTTTIASATYFTTVPGSGAISYTQTTTLGTAGTAPSSNTTVNNITRFANAGTFAGSGTRCCQWKNERILIVDVANGYFDYDTVTLTSYQNSIYSVTINSAGGNFTVAPTIVATGGGGSGATFSSQIGSGNVISINSGGTNYQVGDILSVTLGAGTYASGTQSPGNIATIKVTAVGASNAITGAVVNTPGAYATAPANPVSVTGGYGSGATINLGWLLGSITVTNKGGGYTSIPTLLINPSTAPGNPVYITNSGSYTGTAPANPVSTTGGTGAGFTANAIFGLTGITSSYYAMNSLTWQSVSNAGYQIGDVLTCVGGTSTIQAQVKVTNIVYVSSLAYPYIYYFSIQNQGNYSVWPASRQFTTTGGHGSGFMVGWTQAGVGTSYAVMGIVSATVAAAGAGYTNNDVLTVSGGTPITAAQFTYQSIGASGGAILTANLNLSINGSAIASYAGRVWMVTSTRTVVFSAPGSYQDFLTGDAAGSFIMTDETMRSPITALKAANNYLYIAGVTSMFMLSDVSVQQPAAGTTGSPTTIYSLNNLSTSFGTDLPDAILPHYRSLLYGSDYGWYMLTGVTPQKISDPLDGLLANSNFSTTTAGQLILYGQLCECWLVQYTDPVSHVTTAMIMVFFNNKWFLSMQKSTLTLITGGISADAPALFGTDGVNIYKLFSDTATPRAFKVQTKQWDMGNSLMTKLGTRVGVDMTMQNATTVNISADSETGSTSAIIPIPGPGYYFSIANIGATGNYLGLTLTGNATPGDVITGISMEYAMHTPWSPSRK